MFRWIIESSLKFRFLVIAAAAAMVVFGIGRLQQMPVDVFPEFAPPKVEIQTEGMGMGTAEVEDLITIPLEEVLRGTPGVDFMRSKSVVGLSSIQMIFKRGTDLLFARQVVSERLGLAVNFLPGSAGTPVMVQPLSSTSRAMKIGLESKTMDLMDLSMIAYWKIKFQLLRVPGVANVAIWGERLKQMQVQVDPDQLKKLNVSLNEVMESTSNALDFGLLPWTPHAKTRIDGFLETADQRLDIQHIQPVTSPTELSRIPVNTKDGRRMTLSDIGKVVWDFPPLWGDAVINDGPGLMLIVEKFPWANTLQVTEGVEKIIAEMKPGLEGVEIDTTIFRPATYIKSSIDNLTTALLLGCVFVVIILFVFLYEWRVALISLTAIPLSLVAAGLVLYMNGTVMNTMVLAGFVVAIGAVVDDAIIDIENIVRRLRKNRREGIQKTTFMTVLDASLEVRSAVVYATIIEVMALIPVFFMGGLSGAFFEPLAASYALAVLASMVVALTVTPALGLILLRDAPLERRESPIIAGLQKGYMGLLEKIVSAPRSAYLTTGAIVLAGIVVWPLLGKSLLPSFKERDFLMHWLTKPGTSHPEMYRITVASSKELRAIPGVRNFGAHIGRALVADEVVGMYFTENWISIDPKVDYQKTLDKVQEVVDGYPGIYRDVQTYLKERIREVLTGAGEALVLRIYGPELDGLYESAERVKKALEGVEGLVELHVGLQKTVPQIQIKVDLEKAGKFELKPGDVRRAASAIINGYEVSDIHSGGRVYDVMVWSVPEKRNSLTAIERLLIDTPNGGQVQLQDVADVTIRPTPNVIKRENLSRRIDVDANTRGRDLGSIIADVEDRLKDVKLPLGYHLKVLGEWAERQKAQKNILWTSIAAAIGILFLLQAAFRNWRLALLAFPALPAALVGGVLAAYIGGGSISLGSLVGFLTVLGIAARNGIMMINHFQHLEEYEGETFGKQLVLRGAKERLAPILMTALTTGLALIPLVFAGDIPGHEIELPMAVVILGGLITSTLLNLFLIPSLYLKFGTSREPDVSALPQGA